MKTLLTAVLALGLVSEARAEKVEVFVPYECVTLAQEFGVSLASDSLRGCCSRL